MEYELAKETCHVRSGIYRTSVGKIYWKNHTIPLDEQVDDFDKQFMDWEEYDPREQPDCSGSNEMPA